MNCVRGKSLNTNTLASNPACVFIKVEQVIEELCTNWSIGSETVDVILNANVIIIRPNCSPANITAFTDQKISFRCSTPFNFRFGEEHLFQFIKFKSVPVKVGSCNIWFLLTGTVCRVERLSCIMLKY